LCHFIFINKKVFIWTLCIEKVMDQNQENMEVDLNRLNLETSAQASRVNSSTSFISTTSDNFQLAVPAVAGPSGLHREGPPQKRKRGEQPRKPNISEGNLPAYRQCRTLMVKRIKWNSIVNQLKQYKELKSVPVYCQINKPVPQIWQTDSAFTKWWTSHTQKLQDSLFTHLLECSEAKLSEYSSKEIESKADLGKSLTSQEVQEAIGAFSSLEKRLVDQENTTRRQALARDIGGKRIPPRRRGNYQQSKRAPPKKAQGPRTKRDQKAGQKRKATQGQVQDKDSNAKLAEIIAASIRAAKQQGY
jgi:hypothetical protein